jgi:hypothetical protein
MANARPSPELLRSITEYYELCITVGSESTKAKAFVKNCSDRYPDFADYASKVDECIRLRCEVPWMKDGLGR